jgi:RsiW-degrading membrane proteinase PrsW (M82 family)
MTTTTLRARHRRLSLVALAIVVLGGLIWLNGNATADTLFVAAVAPALYIVWHFHHADKYKTESFLLLFGTFALGAVSAFIAAGLEVAIMPKATSGVTFIIFLGAVAIIEELAKFVSVRVLAYRSPHFDETMDGVIFGITAAMGFAAVENVGYVLQYGAASALFRAFVSVPAHAFFGAVMGYYLGEAKVRRNAWLAVLGLAIAMMLHWLFDSLDSISGAFGLILLPVFVWFVYFTIVKKEIARAAASSALLHAPRQG